MDEEAGGVLVKKVISKLETFIFFHNKNLYVSLQKR